MATRPIDNRTGSRNGTRAKRVVVVANEAVGGEDLVEQIVRRLGESEDAEVMIVSPALVASPLDLAAGDVDDDIEAARERLQRSVQALGQRGIQASGEVGEAEPGLALRDTLVKFPADEVIIVAHPDEYATWLEKHLLERTRRELSVPITHIEVVPHAGTPTVKEVAQVAPAGPRVAAEQRQQEFDTDYLPPMPARDRAALALAVLGTPVLWLLAASCRGHLPHDFSGDAGCIAITIMAIFGLIITAVHVPALLLLRSGRGTSRGLADFMSLFIFVYFVPSLLASAVIASVV